MRYCSQVPSYGTNANVCILLDACHMLKLIINLFGDKKYIMDGTGKASRFKYIEKLYYLPKTCGLIVRNKLRDCHLQYIKKNECKISFANVE